MLDALEVVGELLVPPGAVAPGAQRLGQLSCRLQAKWRDPSHRFAVAFDDERVAPVADLFEEIPELSGEFRRRDSVLHDSVE